MKKKTKVGKKLLSLLLTAGMLLTIPGMPALAETVTSQSETPTGRAATPANPVHHCTKDTDESGDTDTTDWSYVYFGSYPQTEVTGDALTTAITGASYDVNGDAWVGGTKYRRISKEDTNYSGYFGDSAYRYFKWERIKWRVLQNDGSTLFVVADQGIDCKDYNDTYTSITWENSTLRNWLNSSFYSTAFSSGEQGAIVEQNVVNEDNPEYGTEGGNDTRDKVYLLSIEETTNPDYGFCEDYSTESASRRLKTSDYAHARGAWNRDDSSYAGNCWWWLRSPGYYTDFAVGFNSHGYVSRYGLSVDDIDDAVVPALHFNLSSDLWSTADDGSSGSGGGSEDEDKNEENGNSEEEPEFINTHKNFIEQSQYNSLMNDWDLSQIALNEIGELKDEYDTWRAVRGNIFDNPYEIVLAEMILNETSVEAQKKGFKLNLYAEQRTIINSLMDLMNSKVELTADKKNKIQKLFSEKNFDDDETYKLCKEILSKHISEDELKTVFQFYDTGNNFMSLLGDAEKIVESVTDVINYGAILQAYTKTSDDFKRVLMLTDYYCQGENAELDYAIVQYVTMDDKYDISKSILEKVVNNSIDVGLEVFEDSIIEKTKMFLLENMDLSKAGTKVATGLLAAVEGIEIGYDLGTAINNVFLNTDDVTDAYVETYATAKLAHYMKFVVESSATALVSDATIENANLFCKAFSTYKYLQLEMVADLMNYFSENKQGFFAKLFRDPTYDAAIYRWQLMKMHWDDVECHNKTNETVEAKSITIACPVDVVIKDKEGNAVLQIVNNAVRNDSGKAVATIRNNIKYITVPDNSYDILLTATDDGTMSYRIEEYNHKTEPSNTVAYEDIELKKGKTYAGTITEGEELSVQKNALYSDGIVVESKPAYFTNNDKIEVSAINLSTNKLELSVGNSAKLEMSILPANASYKGVTWYSADRKIADVDEYGEVSAISEGETVIYCSTLDGVVTSQCNVIVKKVGSDNNEDTLGGEGNISDGGNGESNTTLLPDNNSTGTNTDNTPATVVLNKISLSKSEVVYNGKAQTPVVTVFDASGQTVEASNYTATYNSNINVGQATITVTGVGKYTGTLTAIFDILPKSTNISKVTATKKGFTVKWKKQKKQVSGYEIQYCANENFKGAKTATIKKAKTASAKIKKLKAKKKYYVRIRTYKTVRVIGKSKKFYSGWSQAKVVKIKK